jgi:hypothetical protein
MKKVKEKKNADDWKGFEADKWVITAVMIASVSAAVEADRRVSRPLLQAMGSLLGQ